MTRIQDAALLCAAVFFLASPPPASGADGTVAVRKVEGKASYQGKELTAEDRVGPGSIAVKGDGAFVDLKYPGGHVVRIKEGEAEILSDGSGSESAEIEIRKGTLGVYVPPAAEKAKATEEPRFRVRTRAAVMGVRGTKFLVQETEKDTYVCVCEGTVLVRGKHDERIAVALNARADIHVSADRPLGNPTRANDMMWKMATELFEGMELR